MVLQKGDDNEGAGAIALWRDDGPREGDVEGDDFVNLDECV